ncbi:hypothetical protein GCM10027063_05590 [Promicromonospora xylanilytica]
MVVGAAVAGNAVTAAPAASDAATAATAAPRRVVRSVLIDRSFELGAGRPRPGVLPVRIRPGERPARLAAYY